jgi:hypothetical protein
VLHSGVAEALPCKGGGFKSACEWQTEKYKHSTKYRTKQESVFCVLFAVERNISWQCPHDVLRPSRYLDTGSDHSVCIHTGRLKAKQHVA